MRQRSLHSVIHYLVVEKGCRCIALSPSQYNKFVRREFGRVLPALPHAFFYYYGARIKQWN